MKNSKINQNKLGHNKDLQNKNNQELIKRLILEQTDAKVKDRFSDKELDAENEKRKILEDINDLWKIKQISNNILNQPADYEAIFTARFN